MLELVEVRSGELGLLIEPGLADADDMGLSGILGAGVFDLECQTPSTSIPLSRARTPNGTPGSPRRRGGVVCCMSCGRAVVVAAMVVYFRSLHWLYNSLRQPRPITLTWSCQWHVLMRGGHEANYSKCQDLCSRVCQHGYQRAWRARDQQRTKHIFSHSAHESKNFLDMTLRSSFFSDGQGRIVELHQ